MLDHDPDVQLLGRSPQMERLRRQIALAGHLAAPALVGGERGTGKHLVARLLHRASGTVAGPLVTFPCMAFRAATIGAALFGSVADGPDRVLPGAVSRAEGGTLLLQDVESLPLDVQESVAQLVRDGSYLCAGDDRPRRADLRIVANSTVDLEAAVAGRRFRSDLLCLLSVSVLPCSALRDRLDDVPDLVDAFLDRACARAGIWSLRPRLRQLRALQRYGWPGNVSELRIAVELAVLRRDGRNLPLAPPDGGASGFSESIDVGGQTIATEAEMKQRERDNVLVALREAGWRVSGPLGAAAMLGINPTTLSARMKVMRITRPG